MVKIQNPARWAGPSVRLWYCIKAPSSSCFLEELHYLCSERGDTDPDDQPRDSEGGKEQNQTTIVQFCRSGGDGEGLAYEEHRAIVLEYRIVMGEVVDRVSMLDREGHGGWSAADRTELEIRLVNRGCALAANSCHLCL
jgi:hypothetical protein